MKLLWVQLYNLQSMMLFDCVLGPLLQSKTWCHFNPNALANMIVFFADLRLEFGGKTIAGLSMAS